MIAPVQALLVQRLLETSVDPNSATKEESRNALYDALTEALMICCGPGPTLVRLLLNPPGAGPAAVKKLVLNPEGCEVLEFISRNGLRSAWSDARVTGSYFPHDFSDESPCAGVILLLYSAMMTHGLDAIRQEVDSGEIPSMVGRHGYCTQEAVNLLITGKASSNVFDGERALDGGLSLKGVSQRPKVGFLSLFEAFGSLQVGKNLKEPVWPVWVVHAESHYSLLFSTCDFDKGEEDSPVDVWYYDPLGYQDEVKRITIRPGALSEPPDEDDLEVNGMIAKVIRTRWGVLSELDWNGSEPIY